MIPVVSAVVCVATARSSTSSASLGSPILVRTTAAR